MNNMNNMLNSKLLELLSGVDRSKIEQVGKMVSGMSKEDLNSLAKMLGQNISNNDSKDGK
ncbi:MAG: hypothetical protein RR290_02520 [Clostridia bacterium]